MFKNPKKQESHDAVSAFRGKHAKERKEAKRRIIEFGSNQRSFYLLRATGINMEGDVEFDTYVRQHLGRKKVIQVEEHKINMIFKRR